VVPATSFTDSQQRAQTLIVSVGLLVELSRSGMGIHAILGFFLAGTMAGSAKEVTRELPTTGVSDTLHAIFVPAFLLPLVLKLISWSDGTIVAYPNLLRPQLPFG